jgi:hypothetical protein
MKIGLIGGGFHHAFSSTLSKKPTYFEWSKGNIEDVTFFIDDSISQGLNTSCKRKFAWLVESRDIIPNAIEYVKNNYEAISKSYELLFTHSKEIYDLADNFVYLPSHGYWIEFPKIYNKTKLVSMISSSKNWTNGHRYRLQKIEEFRNKVDLYGRGFNEIDKKEQGLCDYMFSIVVENDSYKTYWSEKILDCFATGTIPIYYGSPDISNYFNMDGIIILDENFNIEMLNESEYLKRLDAIKDNFNRCLEYDIIEDIIFEKWIKE